jgi:hypothetical protein
VAIVASIKDLFKLIFDFFIVGNKPSYHDVIHRGTMMPSELALGFNTEVVALCLSFPTHSHGPQSDTRSFSYGFYNELLLSSFFVLFMHFLYFAL